MCTGPSRVVSSSRYCLPRSVAARASLRRRSLLAKPLTLCPIYVASHSVLVPWKQLIESNLLFLVDARRHGATDEEHAEFHSTFLRTPSLWPSCRLPRRHLHGGVGVCQSLWGELISCSDFLVSQASPRSCRKNTARLSQCDAFTDIASVHSF